MLDASTVYFLNSNHQPPHFFFLVPNKGPVPAIRDCHAEAREKCLTKALSDTNLALLKKQNSFKAKLKRTRLATKPDHGFLTTHFLIFVLPLFEFSCFIFFLICRDNIIQVFFPCNLYHLHLSCLSIAPPWLPAMFHVFFQAFLPFFCHKSHFSRQVSFTDWKAYVHNTLAWGRSTVQKSTSFHILLKCIKIFFHPPTLFFYHSRHSFLNSSA